MKGREKVMSEWSKYREMMKHTRELASVRVSSSEMEAAMDAVKERMGMGVRKQMHRRRVLIWSGSIAAALGIAITLMTLGVLTKRGDAAEELRQIAEVNKSYKGWIHGELVQEKGAATQAQGAGAAAAVKWHTNTVDGRN